MIVRDIGREIRLRRRDKVYHRRQRRHLGTEPMLRKGSHTPKPAALRERGNTDRKRTEPSHRRAALTEHR
jgi:hypothetical protein